MKIKIIYNSLEDGDYTAQSSVLPNCIGRGETRGDALNSFVGEVKYFIEIVEKELSVSKKGGDIAVVDL